MNDELPGVHLRVTATDLRLVGSTKTASIKLVGEVRDEVVWTSVRDRLQAEGLKIYSIDDFKTELLNAMRSEVVRLEACVRLRDREIRELKHQNNMLQLGTWDMDMPSCHR